MGFVDVFGVVLLVIGYCGWIISTEDLEWSSFTLEKVGGSHYPNIPPLALGIVRSICAAIIVATLHYLYTDTGGIELFVLMRDGSKRKVKLRHGERFTPFTVWSWMLQVTIYAQFSEYYSNPFVCRDFSSYFLLLAVLLLLLTTRIQF